MQTSAGVAGDSVFCLVGLGRLCSLFPGFNRLLDKYKHEQDCRNSVNLRASNFEIKILIKTLMEYKLKL